VSHVVWLELSRTAVAVPLSDDEVSSEQILLSEGIIFLCVFSIN
jgi:hypothetical protein